MGLNGSLRLPAACWILHQGVRGMDYKRQSSRDNEEKQNANAHCLGCCGNYTEMLLLFFFLNYCWIWDVSCRSQIHKEETHGFLRVMQENKLFLRNMCNVVRSFTMSHSWMNAGIQMLKVGKHIYSLTHMPHNKSWITYRFFFFFFCCSYSVVFFFQMH